MTTPSAINVGTANPHSHLLGDEPELDYRTLLNDVNHAVCTSRRSTSKRKPTICRYVRIRWGHLDRRSQADFAQPCGTGVTGTAGTRVAFPHRFPHGGKRARVPLRRPGAPARERGRGRRLPRGAHRPPPRPVVTSG